MAPLLVETVFLLRAPVGSYDDTRAQTGTLTSSRAEAPFVAVTKGKA